MERIIPRMVFYPETGWSIDGPSQTHPRITVNSADDRRLSAYLDETGRSGTYAAYDDLTNTIHLLDTDGEIEPVDLLAHELIHWAHFQVCECAPPRYIGEALAEWRER